MSYPPLELRERRRVLWEGSPSGNPRESYTGLQPTSLGYEWKYAERVPLKTALLWFVPSKYRIQNLEDHARVFKVLAWTRHTADAPQGAGLITASNNGADAAGLRHLTVEGESDLKHCCQRQPRWQAVPQAAKCCYEAGKST